MKLMAAKWQGAWSGWLVAVLMLALAGCKQPSTRPDPPRGEGDAPLADQVELDENTDPRFRLEAVTADPTAAAVGAIIGALLQPERSGGGASPSPAAVAVQGGIGRLTAYGRQVFVDNRRVRRTASLRNGAVVRTGAASQALLQFRGERDCRLLVEDFRVGRMYGDSKACTHVVGLPLDADASGLRGTAYLLETGAQLRLSGRVRVTVVRGELAVRARGRTGSVEVPRYHEVIVSGSGVSVPRPLSRAEVRQRLDWRPTGKVPPAATVTVPSLYGKTRAEAEQILERLGLRARVEPAGAGADWWVYAQVPDKGKAVKAGAEVLLRVQAQLY